MQTMSGNNSFKSPRRSLGCPRKSKIQNQTRATRNPAEIKPKSIQIQPKSSRIQPNLTKIKSKSNQNHIKIKIKPNQIKIKSKSNQIQTKPSQTKPNQIKIKIKIEAKSKSKPNQNPRKSQEILWNSYKKSQENPIEVLEKSQKNLSSSQFLGLRSSQGLSSGPWGLPERQETQSLPSWDRSEGATHPVAPPQDPVRGGELLGTTKSQDFYGISLGFLWAFLLF